MISMVSFESGPVPKPMRRPMALLSPKKCFANFWFTIATVGVFLRIGAREVAPLEDRNAHGLEIAAATARS